MAVEMEPKYLRPEIIAQELDVSEKVIKRLIQIGELEGIRVGKEYRIPRSAYEQFLRDHTVNGTSMCDCTYYNPNAPEGEAES